MSTRTSCPLSPKEASDAMTSTAKPFAMAPRSSVSGPFQRGSNAPPDAALSANAAATQDLIASPPDAKTLVASNTASASVSTASWRMREDGSCALRSRFASSQTPRATASPDATSRESACLICTAATVPIAGHSTRSTGLLPLHPRRSSSARLKLDHFILKKDLQFDVLAVHRAESLAHRVLGDMRNIAIARQMGERQLPEPRRGELADEFARLVVGEMSARTRDALDHAGRTSALPEKDGVVVGFQDRDVGLSELHPDRIEGRSDVRAVEIRAAAGSHELADGAAGVMGNRKRIHAEPAEFEILPVLEADEGGLAESAVVDDRLRRHRVRIDRNVAVLPEYREAGHVGGVTVGDQDRVELDVLEMLIGNSAIDQDCGTLVLDQIGIALRAAR